MQYSAGYAKEFFYVTVPIRDRSSENKRAETTMRVPMLLPHEVLSYVSDPWPADMASKTSLLEGV